MRYKLLTDQTFKQLGQYREIRNRPIRFRICQI